MSLNDKPDPADSFDNRQMNQIYIQEHKALRPNEIKNTSRGLRAFVFYRNRRALKQHKRRTPRFSVTISIA